MNVFVPTILLTRPEVAAAGFETALRGAGVKAEVVISPLIEIVPTAAEADFNQVQGVIFSSRNGVAAVPGRALPAWCVGAATASAAKAKGWRAVAADGDAEALYRRVLADAPTGRLLHLRGEHARGDLANRLTTAGIKTREIVVYRQELRDLSGAAIELLARPNPVIVPLYSPRTATQFAANGPYVAPIVVVAISAAVAQMVAMMPTQRVVIAARPDGAAMVQAVAKLMEPSDAIETRGDLA